MEIACIIPTYNRKHLLQRAIDSVYNQTYPCKETIVIDDGSTDGTAEWIQKKYPQVIFIFQENQGVSSARNAGIKATNSKWIALLDSDDEWLPNKLEKQIKILRSNPEYSFCHTNEVWIRNGVHLNQMKKHQKYGGEIFFKILDMCRISPSSTLFHRSILDQVGYFDEDFLICEDYDLWIRISAEFQILFLDEFLIKKYGGHNDQLSKVSDGIERYRIEVLEKLINNNFPKDQFSAIRSELIKKLKIFCIGAKKRQKPIEYKNAIKRIDELSLTV